MRLLNGYDVTRTVISVRIHVEEADICCPREYKREMVFDLLITRVCISR